MASGPLCSRLSPFIFLDRTTMTVLYVPHPGDNPSLCRHGVRHDRRHGCPTGRDWAWSFLLMVAKSLDSRALGRAETTTRGRTWERSLRFTWLHNGGAEGAAGC